MAFWPLSGPSLLAVASGHGYGNKTYASRGDRMRYLHLPLTRQGRIVLLP